MRNLSFYESRDSTGEVSLKSLFSGTEEVSGRSKIGYSDMARLLVRGGWPRSIGIDEEYSYDIVEGYCEGLLDSEINLPGGRRRDRQRMRHILRSLARNTATSVPNTTILTDINSNGESSISVNTLADYISALEGIYVVEDMDSWSPRLRSKTAIRTSAVRHFSDPAIAAYFLGAKARDLEMDPNTFGLLFESLVVRDLRIYARSLGGEVYHYRDADGLEADAIIHLNDGRWGAIEVKLGSHGIDAGARNLIRLAHKVDTENMGAPSFLAVVTATEFAYTREDGVHVIPLGCLRD
jgi:predicted AAA+ superfamily ATPase